MAWTKTPPTTPGWYWTRFSLPWLPEEKSIPYPKEMPSHTIEKDAEWWDDPIIPPWEAPAHQDLEIRKAMRALGGYCSREMAHALVEKTFNDLEARHQAYLEGLKMLDINPVANP